MGTSRVIPLHGTDQGRIAAALAGLILDDEIHTIDQHRIFHENVLLAPVWQGVIASEAAMLTLNTSNTTRGCFPIDICKRSDTSSFWLCISNRGELITDWIELGGGGTPVPVPVTADDVSFFSTNPKAWTVQTVVEYLLSRIQALPVFGGAASLNVGTTAGTVAAGDDARFTSGPVTVYARDVLVDELGAEFGNVGFVLKYLIARITSLGTAAFLNVGTTAGTVAAGDDSRFTPATPITAKDLVIDELNSELGNVDAAIRYLIARVSALGGASLLAIGTTAGTVAAGDDTRFAGASVGNLTWLFMNCH